MSMRMAAIMVDGYASMDLPKILGGLFFCWIQPDACIALEYPGYVVFPSEEIENGYVMLPEAYWEVFLPDDQGHPDEGRSHRDEEREWNEEWLAQATREELLEYHAQNSDDDE